MSVTPSPSDLTAREASTARVPVLAERAINHVSGVLFKQFPVHSLYLTTN